MNVIFPLVTRTVNGYTITEKRFDTGETWFYVDGDTETHGRFRPMDCRVIFRNETGFFRVGFTGLEFYELCDAVSATVSMAMREFTG